jgi:hypothetical protein
MNQIKRAALAALAVAAPFAASAQTAGDPFNDALTEITTNVTTYGGALVGLAAVGVVFMIAIKYVKKLRGAA